MKEIIFDTETTGFNPHSGDRLVEIGCVEVENYLPTGRVFHQYINPERDMPEGAFRIHGLSAEYLRDYPTFSEIYGAFIDFIGAANLVAHNADFDMKFINWELSQVGHAKISPARAVDTLAMARKKYPGANNTLDALCKRFDIDNSNRIRHGALLDAELLAEVYLELKGGRQRGFELVVDNSRPEAVSAQTALSQKNIRPPRPHRATDAELERHKAFITGMGDKSLWHKLNIESEPS